MDAGPDTRSGLDSTSVVDRLRERHPDAVRAFLLSWAGAVARYCRTVCEVDLVAEAVEVTDEHVLACRRCQASARRFQAAEKAFPKSKGVGVREEVVEELLQRLVPHEPG